MNGRSRMTQLGLTAITVALLLPLGLRRVEAAGSVSLTAPGAAYTQDFDTLASAGASSAVPDGWAFTELGTNANLTYTAGTGSSSTAETYSFGASGSSERAFGGLRGGSLVPVIGASFTNNTGQVITGLTVSYVGEQWRAGVTSRNAADRIDFQLSTDATSLTTGTWVDEDGLDFRSPNIDAAAGALNGNAPLNRTAVSFTIGGLGIAAGATFWVRWADFDIASNDDGLAVDDFSLTPEVAAPPSAPAGVGAASPDRVSAGNDTLLTVAVTPGANPTSTGLAVTADLSAIGGAAAQPFFDDASHGDLAGADGIYSFLASVPVTTPAGETSLPVAITDAQGRRGSAGIGLVVVAAVSACELPYTPAHAIQGAGQWAAITGPVTTQGVVVGDYEGPPPNLGGFYLQDLDGDGDPATSDAIFVSNHDRDSVHPGEVVRVTGSADEVGDQTLIGSVTAILSCGAGSVVPVEITLPLPAAGYLEQYEGMLVRLPQTLSVTSTFELGRLGQVTVSSGGRLAQPTSVTTPGAAASGLQAQNDLNRITLDDPWDSEYPDPILFGRGGLPLSGSNPLRGGDTVTGAVGIITVTAGGDARGESAYRLRPIGALTGQANFEAANPRPTSGSSVGGSLRVASMNLFNFFNTFHGCAAGVGGASTECRGAENAAEFSRQWPKSVAAILAVNADVLGLTEMENDGYGGDSAIQFLVDRLNAASAPGTYAFVDADEETGQTNALGLDAVKVGLVYRPAAVQPVGQTAALSTDSFVAGGDAAPRNRPAIAQAFRVAATGAVFIVNVSHLKSRDTACDEPDAGDGQGDCNTVRANAVAELLSWLSTDPTATGDPDLLIVGDYNAYANEDPIVALRSSGFIDLLSGIGAGAYSFAFDGQWGYVDHALASPSLVSQVSGVDVYHINADEPAVLDYRDVLRNPEQLMTLYAPDEFRASDHDPVVVGLDLHAPLTVAAGGPYATCEGLSVAVGATGSVAVGDPPAFAWDLDGDGSFESPGRVVSFSAAGLDGPSSHQISVKATGAAGATAVARATVEVLNARPGVMATPATQSVQYSDPLFPVTIAGTDVAADLPLFIATEWNVDGGHVATGLPAWLVLGGGCVPGESTGGCTWTLSGLALTMPGLYVVRVTVVDKDGGATTQAIAIEVVPEDARVTYTGALYGSTVSASSGSATVTLAATVQDISATAEASADSLGGDIRNARVTFVDRSANTPIAGCADLPIGLVIPGDQRSGTVTCDWSVTIGGDAQDFTVGIVVRGSYARDASEDGVVVMVAKPLADNFITGGGHLVLRNSAGEKAGDPGTSANFGFEVKYNKRGANLQGRSNLIVRRTEADGLHVYQIKANAMTSLAMHAGSRTASFNARASIQDITDPLTPIAVDGSAVLQVTMIDNGEPGANDELGITVWNKSGGLWFATNWNGVRTVEQWLDAGNLVVH